MSGNGGDGLQTIFSTAMLVEKSSFTDNGQSGIELLQGSDGESRLEKSSFSGNDVGISIHNLRLTQVVRNRIFGNRVGIDLFEPEMETVRDNRITNNSGDGILVSVAGRFGGNLIEGNVASQNGDDGIDTASVGPFSGLLTVTRNTANENADLGIVGSPGVMDGGGNKASRNGNPAQCVDIACK